MISINTSLSLRTESCQQNQLSTSTCQFQVLITKQVTFGACSQTNRRRMSSNFGGISDGHPSAGDMNPKAPSNATPTVKTKMATGQLPNLTFKEMAQVPNTIGSAVQPQTCQVYLKILATHDVSSMQRFVCPWSRTWTALDWVADDGPRGGKLPQSAPKALPKKESSHQLSWDYQDLTCYLVATFFFR